MKLRQSTAGHRERGIVLITSLLLLLVVTLIALSMFRSFGIQERISGNMREKARTLQAAISAEEFAENWMINGGVTSSAPVTCNALLNGNLGFGQICSNPILPANVASPPWQVSGANVGVSFTPPSMVVSTTTAGSTVLNPSYYQTPIFYIADAGTSADASIPGEIYQIDAAAWGGNQTTVAVVESTFAVYSTSSNRTL